MLGFAWLTLRQVQEALKNGRLEEAQRLLQQPSAQGHRKAGELLVQLARRLVQRGERQLRLDDAEGAWRDLFAAEQLRTDEKGADRLRQALTGLGMAEVRALLRAGETARAEEAAARLAHRGARSPEFQVLAEGVRGWAQARELAERGEFAQAVDAAERAKRLLGANRLLDEFHADLVRRKETFVERLGRLHEAADANRWREVIESAEQVLSAAPQHAEARALRAKAWRAVEPVTVALAAPTAEPNGTVVGLDTATSPHRFLLWIDGVGGYLLCLGSRLTFGQAGLDARVDVPLVADVSRLHATLARDAEGWVLEAVRPIQVNGQTATRALLQSGDRVTLGASCQFQFRLPVPGSNTARLDLVSGHRLPLGVDGVLLVAEALVLGGVAQAHVTVPDMAEPIVLFRHKDGLGLRHSAKLRVNGQQSGGRTLLGPHAAVAGDDISFAIEPAGAMTGKG